VNSDLDLKLNYQFERRITIKFQVKR